MSRVIKFRVWSKNWGSMIYTDPLVGHSWGVTTDIFGMKENHAFAGANARANKGFFEEFAHYDPSYFLLEQFTGLTDKNGKDIYEGDIVEWEHTRDDILPKRGPVVWGEYSDGEYAENLDCWMVGHDPLSCHIKYAGYGATGWVARDSVRVIGNIHENPELLSHETQGT
jgi:uncharacterized phage protein (TIGR01671 family)